MERVAIIAHLKAGSVTRAAELIAKGAPYDLASTGIVRHSVYLSANEVVLVFEGHQVEWMVDDLIDEPLHPEIQSALEQWRAIVDEPPRIAREQFGWERSEEDEKPATATAGSDTWA